VRPHDLTGVSRITVASPYALARGIRNDDKEKSGIRLRTRARIGIVCRDDDSGCGVDGVGVTIRKHDLPLPARTPAWVSRDVGAAELCISPETWDRMVAADELPKPDQRFLGTMPRWEWNRVTARLKNRQDQATMPRDAYVIGAESARGKTQGQRRA
jgi:hypothetical protein